jgi:tyrosine-protein kinase Etk/Wzc
MDHIDTRKQSSEVGQCCQPSMSHHQEEISVSELFHAVMRDRWLITKATVGCGVLAAGVSLILPQWYTASASLLPPHETQSTASMLMSQIAGTGLGSLASLASKDIGLKNPNDLYVGILQSRTLKDRLIARFSFQTVYEEKILSDARKKLEKHVSLESTKDGLIHISFEDRDPGRAAAVANAYIDELRNIMQHVAVTEAARRRVFFAQEVRQAQDNLARAEEAMKDTQQTTGVIQIDSQAKAVIEAIGRLHGQIAATEVELRAMRSFATDQNSEVVLTQENLSALKAQLAKLERQQSTNPADPLLTFSKMPGAALTYVRRLRDVKYREAVFETLAKQFEAAKLDEAKDAAVIPPDRRSFPKRTLIIALTTGAALLGSILFSLASAAMKPRLQGIRQP